MQDEVVERLFVAYFENGEDIGDIRVLADIADICGMDGAQIADMLESDADIALVEREDQMAHEMGVTGVPAMIFGNKHRGLGRARAGAAFVGDRPGGGDASGSGPACRDRRRS